MTLSEILRDLLYFLIGSGLIVWLVKSIVGQILNKDIEKYKWKLNKETLRFSKLYNERAIVIRDLYYKLFDFEQAMNSFVSIITWAGEKPKEEKRKIAAETGNEFRDFYRKNRIYFSEKIVEILEKMDKIFMTSFINFTTLELDNPDSRAIKPSERVEEWNKVWRRITTEIPELRSELEKEFRGILGTQESLEYHK
ncbi:MAG: hypothetical protein ABIB79_03745 [archaeon]